MTPELDQRPGAPDAPRRPLAPWPPPGLERVQGDLWRVAGRGALVAGVLVLPLLFVAGREQDFAGFGPFGSSWWLTILLGTVGLALAVDTLARAGTVLRRSARAYSRGYEVRTIAQVLADRRGDTGFLLQGARYFAGLDRNARAAIAMLRVGTVVGYVAAGLWMPLALSAGLLMGARGWIGPGELWGLTLLPAAAAFLLGGLAAVFEETLVRRARRDWHRQSWADDLVAEEIAAWKSALRGPDAAGPAGEPEASTRARSGRPLALAGVVLAGLGLLVAVPVLTLLPTSALGPLLASISMPRFSATLQRAARAEAYRPYRLEADSTLDAQEAGRLLQNLLHVGSDRPAAEGMRGPTRRIEVPWESGAENPTGLRPERWSTELFAQVQAGASTGVRAYLAELAAHPARGDISRLARAADIDVASGRWADPMPPGMTIASLPIPRFSGLRSAAYTHVAAAAHDLLGGRPARAEERLREVVSVGLLLADGDPTLIGNLVGAVIAHTGAEGLVSFYDATGRARDATELRRVREAAERAAARAGLTGSPGPEGYARGLPALVVDTAVVRGLRWEYFGQIITVAPCGNLHQMVFGPDEQYRSFVRQARAALVRWPSEQPIFEMFEQGYWGPSYAGGGLVGRVLGVSMWPGAGGCGEIVKRWNVLRELI